MDSRPPAPWVRRFVARHGWRAYFLPVLVVVTAAALLTLDDGKHDPGRPADASAPNTAGAPPAAEASGTLKVDQPEGQVEHLPADALPGGAVYTRQGDGTFRVIPGSSKPIGSGPRRTFVIEIENGVTGIDAGTFATRVMQVLSDGRSWAGSGALSLQRVSDAGGADFRVSLTSSYTVRTLCGYDQKIETSCYEDTTGVARVNLNNARWVRGDVQFGQDLDMYRIYMVNHEVGHALGHVHAFSCIPGGLAPVMMQQTITLREQEGRGTRICRPNVWPYPTGVPRSQAVTS